MVNGNQNLGPSQAFDFYKHGIASGQKGLYDPFLGPPPREQKMNAYEQRSHAKWNMPDAYVGENKTLRDTMEDYMLTAQWDWYTERIMPWYKVDDIHLQWSEWDNNPHYLGITPHQSASRIVTQKRTIRKASIIRRGIAAEFEHDFVKTALGRTSFMASLAQMARSVQETANVEVIRALLHCQHSQQVYIRKFGIVKDFELDEYHKRRADRFMIAQKDPFGLEKLSTEIANEQEVYGGRADVWILDRSVVDYTELVPENRILYYKGGQEAVDRINGRSSGQVAAGGTMGNIDRLGPERMIKGTPVFIAKSFHVENLGKADLMSRVTEIGVYNTMIDRTVDYNTYTSASRKIRVYDEDIDGWSDIEFDYALRHCSIWQENGELKDVYSGTNRARSHRAAQDDDFDFLSMIDGNGQRVNIQYIGDMAHHYQTEHDLIDAAQTMLNAAVYGDKDEARRVMREYATNKNADGIIGPIKNLLGKNNLFESALNDQASFTNNFTAMGSALAFPAQSATGSRAPMGSNDTVAELEKRFISETLGAALPDSHQARVREIASQTSVDWKVRAQSIKDMVLQTMEADPTSIKSLRTPADVDKWHQKNVDGFSRRRADEVRQASASVHSEENGKYFSVHAPLPAGWRWANPNEIHVSPLARMPAFQQHIAGSASKNTTGFAARRARIGATPAGGTHPSPLDSEELAQRRAQEESDRTTAPTGAGATVFGGGFAANARWNNLGNMITRIQATGAHPLLKALAVVYAGTRFNRDVLCNYIKNNIAVKVGLLLMRPHCTYRTKFGIKCLSGGGAGYTFFGHSDMQIEHEAARKVGMMHYTTYLSCVVLYPKNVYVVEDLYCDKALGGMGVEFWTPEKYRNGTYKRNSYDIICAPLPPSRKKMEQKIDVRGRWYTEMRRQLVSEDRFNQPLYESCGRINKLFGWYDESRKDRTITRSRVPPNYVCWQGMQWHWNDTLKRFDDYIIESGCMGHEVGPGVKYVRDGLKKELPRFNYHSVNH